MTGIRKRARQFAAPAATAAALEHLTDLALVWDSPTGPRALSGVAEGLAGGPGAGVSGLRTRSPEPMAAEVVAQRLDELSAPARTLLEHVLDHGGDVAAAVVEGEQEPAGQRRQRGARAQAAVERGAEGAQVFGARVEQHGPAEAVVAADQECVGAGD